jgi:redox-sensitive bicupin YhaK (pirin superfamily)
MLYKAPRTTITVPQGGFTINVNFPGHNIPGRHDHGYGPLSVIAESLLEPDTWIRLHEHSNEEIISWVPGGVMRHNDPIVGELVTDQEHLMIMNAGESFWHEELTLADDPHLRMLQIFVRPHTLDLEPRIQHEKLEPPVPGQWRHLFGPEGTKGTDAPFSVRNEVHLYDLRLDEEESADLPELSGWDTYFYVFTGAVEVGGTHFGEAESGLLTGEGGFSVEAEEATLLVAFLIDPGATITRAGTVGR